ncbi:MAG: 3-hydroxyacyl-ACP dehydratase FabZ [Bacillota bacterium]
MLTFKEISCLLKQKPPFVYIDKVLEIEPGKKIKAVKNVTASDNFAAVHFPGNPIFPGVYIIEAAAQTASVYFAYEKKDMNASEDYVYVIGGVQSFQFLSIVRPGDVLVIEVEIMKKVENMAITKTTITVDNNIVARGQMSFGAIKDER